MENKENNIIEHIVISGGGIILFPFYGYIRDSAKKGLWELKNIKSIYGTSAGSLLATIILLNMEWDVIDDYIINRPWKHIFQIKIEDFFSILEKKGLKDIEFIKKTLQPMFESKNIPLDITMKQFYELNNIELHIFVTEVMKFESIDINHITYPDWKLIDAVYASCSIPILFSPLCIDNKYYADGGFLNNFPVNTCILQQSCEPSNMLLLDIDVQSPNPQNEFSFFDFLFTLFVNIFKILSNRKNIPIFENTIRINMNESSLQKINTIIESADTRRELIQEGANLLA